MDTYVIRITVEEIDDQENGPDALHSTAQVLASYAMELEQKINDAYHGRLRVKSSQVGIPR